MHVVEVHYYDQPGVQNTNDVLEVSSKRARQLGVTQVVVASTHGGTALRAREIFADDTRIVAVTISAAFEREGWIMSDSERRAVSGAGVQVLTAMHSLGDDVSEAMVGQGWPPNRMVRETLYRFSQGMKVAIEVALMAAEAGMLDMSADVIAIGGTDSGADTALLLKPAYARDFGTLKIREILAMPR